MELSLGVSYSRSNYSDSNFNWNRRIGFSLGYHITELSEIEFSAQDVIDRTKITGFEDTTFHDQIYSVDWVQAILGKAYAIQPYFKIGVGQLNREASGSYIGGLAPPAILDSVIGVLGAGARIYIMRTFAIRGEFTSYLTGGALGTWQDNISSTVGVSLFF